MEDDKYMKYYLHRISYENELSYTLFKDGINSEKYLSLGWSAFANTDILECARKDDNYSSFEKCFDSIEKEKRRNRWDIWYFAQFKKDDIVVVPLFDGKFGICKVLVPAQSISVLKGNTLKGYYNKKDIKWHNDAFYCDNKKIDIGFVVKVRVLCDDISRKEYADSALTSRLKIRQTNADITDIGNSIEQARSSKEKNKPLNFYNDAIDELTAGMLRQIVEKLNPDKFEILIKKYMEKLGANAIVLSKNQHGKEDYADADVVAFFDNIKVAILIQAKFHTNKTDDRAVEQIKKYKEQAENPNYDLDVGTDDYTYIPWVISACSEYSKEAQNKAKDNKIRLINGEEFARMILEQGLQNIDLE